MVVRATDHPQDGSLDDFDILYSSQVTWHC